MNEKEQPEQSIIFPKITRRGLLRTIGITGATVVGVASLPSPVLAHTFTNPLKGSLKKATVANEETILVESQLSQAILSSPDGQMLINRFGINQVKRSTIKHYRYMNTSLEAVAIAIPQIHASTKNFFVYFQPNQKQFLTFEFEFAPSSSAFTRDRLGLQGVSQSLR